LQAAYDLSLLGDFFFKKAESHTNFGFVTHDRGCDERVHRLTHRTRLSFWRRLLKRLSKVAIAGHQRLVPSRKDASQAEAVTFCTFCCARLSGLHAQRLLEGRKRTSTAWFTRVHDGICRHFQPVNREVRFCNAAMQGLPLNLREVGRK
jgi:hypothetical protein